MSTQKRSGETTRGKPAGWPPEKVAEFHRRREMFARQMRPVAEAIDASQRLSWKDWTTTVNY